MADPPRKPPRPNSPEKVITKKAPAPLPVRRTQLGNVIIDPNRWYGPPESEILEPAGTITPPLLDPDRPDRPLVSSPRPPGQSSRPREHPGFSLTALDPDVSERQTDLAPNASEGRTDLDTNVSEGRSNSTSSISPIFPLRPNPLGPSPLGDASTHTGQSAVSGTTLAGSSQSPRNGGTLASNIGSGTSTPGPSFHSSQTARQSSTSGNPLTQPNVSNASNIHRTRSQLVRHYISLGRPIPQEVLDMPETEPRVRRRDWLPRKFKDFKKWCRRIARRD
ncbi:uncharacterized protein LAJ45_04800 [Morchella importuna]|uniref:uncharacterized protein n=1 Tax=Morchella importuna TaxID=1174673 RepID=UPI001E8CDE3A|nr:uncharacterized protein LAJ45_04800 [Morchella importuna]KAH8151098.1 hypothetical protein LAJ45_04800 [Morchella importuna]